MAADDWMVRLKQSYDNGYYQTEASEGDQTPFPWQNKTCIDCPFFDPVRTFTTPGRCLVTGMVRQPKAHTCRMYDPVNRDEARQKIDKRKGLGQS